ncbi:MAG TPA: hypothetical protein VJH65_02595 [Candidatus Nanoarchaeia archaeon]|nr:hypothetical protein [Candidatus Nanoarchaeia archaeon]
MTLNPSFSKASIIICRLSRTPGSTTIIISLSLTNVIVAQVFSSPLASVESAFVKKKEEKKETLKEKILGKKEAKAEEHKVHETKDEQKLVEEGKVEEKHTKGEQKLQEKHPAEHKGESTEEVSKGKLKFKNIMPSKQKAGRFLKHEKAPKE